MAEPQDRRYAKTHEWVKVEGGEALIGITHYAQEQLGDVVFVELPAVGRTVGAGEAIGTIESVKAVSDLYAPIGGKVIAVNTELDAHPELVNKDPYEGGWLVRVEGPTGVEELLDAASYERFVAEEGGH